MKQTRLRHVKNQMAYFKTLIPHMKGSLCADTESYKEHDDPKHVSRVIELESYKKLPLKVTLLISKASLPFSASLRAVTLKYATHHHSSYMISYMTF